MTYYSDEVYKVERDGLTFTMRLKVDYDSPIHIHDTLGKYTDKDDDYIVDRKLGALVGPYLPEPEEPDAPDPQDFATDVDYDAAEEEYSAAMDLYDAAYDAWDDDWGNREILADNLYTRGGCYTEYRYFKPFAGGESKPGGKYTDLDGEHIIPVEEWTRWAVQDYERAEGLNRGDWCFVGVVVEIDAPACALCGHVEKLTASLWGIESDADDSEFDEIRDNLIEELKRKLFYKPA